MKGNQVEIPEAIHRYVVISSCFSHPRCKDKARRRIRKTFICCSRINVIIIISICI
jgi:hypothetical protein